VSSPWDHAPRSVFETSLDRLLDRQGGRLHRRSLTDPDSSTLGKVKGIRSLYLAASWMATACAHHPRTSGETSTLAALPAAASSKASAPIRSAKEDPPQGAMPEVRVPAGLDAEWLGIGSLAARITTRHAADGAVAALAALYDDSAARVAYSQQRLGVTIAGQPDALSLVARIGAWGQGGEFSDPPPLTSIRLASLQGLDADQARAMVRLFVETVVHEEQLWLSDPTSLASAIAAARNVVADPRAHGGCQQPCVPWPWQTRWSILETSARASWREGDNTADAELLDAAVAWAREALAAIPDATHPLTAAVTERLLAVAQHERAELDPESRGIENALSASRRALTAFATPETRVDRTFTSSNIREHLRALAQREVSETRFDEALAVAKDVVQALDVRTAPLAHARAMMQQAAVLMARYDSLDDREALIAARDLVLQTLQGIRPEASPLLLQRLYGDWCRASSELGAQLSDANEIEKGVKACERALALAPSVKRSRAQSSVAYGLALSRLGEARADVSLLRRAVAQAREGLAGLDDQQQRRVRPWALSSLAVTLRALSGREHTSENLALSRAAFEQSLDLTAKGSDPVRWAKNTLGFAETERRLGWNERGRFQMEAATAHYRKALRAIDEALTVLTKKSHPTLWASLQERAGDLLAREGEIAEPIRFNQALARYQLALSVNRRASDPAAYARTQFGIGVVYLFWADQSMGLDRIRSIAKKSVSAFREALAVRTQLGLVHALGDTKAHLADAVSIVDRVSYRSSCEPRALLTEAIHDNESAKGLWESAATMLQRYEKSDPAGKCSH